MAQRAQALAWQYTAGEAEKQSSDGDPNMGPKSHFLIVAHVMGVIARAKTSNRTARVQILSYDFSAVGFQASPLISRSLFPYLPKWRK